MHISPSKKRYIGITSQTTERRWRNDGNGYLRCSYFWNAIQKYGWENFEHIILAEDLDEEKAKQLEREYIKKYNTQNPKYGYNLTSGGDGVRNWTPSEEWKRKLKERMNENPTMLGKHHSQEVKEKISKMAKERMESVDYRNRISTSLKEYYKIHDNPRKGVTLSDETKKKLSDNHKGNPIYIENGKKRGEQIRRRVNQYDLEGNYIKTFNSILEASNEIGVLGEVISRCCKRRKQSKSAGGFQWRYVDDCDDIGKIIYEEKCGIPKKVNQYNKNMELIKTWNSISEAAKELGLNTSNIINVCKGGKQKTSGGYIWRYAN